MLTTILAEQVGVELETQGGFGSGLFTKIARRNGGGDPLGRAPAGAATPPELVIADAPTEPPLAFADELLIELDHVRAELDAERARLVELEAELDALRAQATARPKRRPSARAAASRAKPKARTPKPRAKVTASTPKTKATRSKKPAAG